MHIRVCHFNYHLIKFYIICLVVSNIKASRHVNRRLPNHRGNVRHKDIFTSLDRSSVFSDIIPLRQRPISTSSVDFSKVFGLESPAQNRNNLNRPRQIHSAPIEATDFEGEENELTEFEPLDVTSKDSPYGLISDVITNSIRPLPIKTSNDLGGLSPKEVWFADGDLLVLKGGTTDFGSSSNFDNVWPPIDNYEAPYREPTFAPDSTYEQDRPDNSDKAPRHIDVDNFKKIPKETSNTFHQSQSPTTSPNFVTNNQGFKSWPQVNQPQFTSIPSTPLRVGPTDFRPSLKLNPSQPSGFHPLSSGRFVAQTGPIAVQTPVIVGSDFSHSTRNSGFQSTKTKPLPNVSSSPSKVSFFDLPNSHLGFVPDDRSKRQNQLPQHDPDVDSLSSPNEDFQEGRTVIHGVYPRVIRHRSPFTVTPLPERVDRTRVVRKTPRFKQKRIFRTNFSRRRRLRGAII